MWPGYWKGPEKDTGKGLLGQWPKSLKCENLLIDYRAIQHVDDKLEAIKSPPVKTLYNLLEYSQVRDLYCKGTTSFSAKIL